MYNHKDPLEEWKQHLLRKIKVFLDLKFGSFFLNSSTLICCKPQQGLEEVRTRPKHVIADKRENCEINFSNKHDYSLWYISLRLHINYSHIIPELVPNPCANVQLFVNLFKPFRWVFVKTRSKSSIAGNLFSLDDVGYRDLF